MDIEILDEVGPRTVGILRAAGSPEVFLTIVLNLPNGLRVVQVDEVFKNTRVASATLRDTLGLGPAADLLDKHAVPRSDALFDLNHSDLWRP